MKKQILICSIFRNRAIFVDRWYTQINDIAEHYKDEYSFSVSIYENDSIDGTKEKLLSLQNTNFSNILIGTEDIKTNYYPSVANEDRVRNLANARNNCLNKYVDLDNFDKVIFIEPDFQYTTKDAVKIISSEKMHNKKFDIISGISLSSGRFYDMWATRKTSEDKEGQITVGDAVEPFWSTFNGFCLYNARPFAQGVRFGWYNERFNKFDCDTAVICENFRKNGYGEIYIDRSAIFNHEE